MNKSELTKKLKKHKKYLYGDPKGERLDLREADLSEAIGNLKEIRSIHLEKYIITYTAQRFFVGCRSGTVGKWKDFEATLSGVELEEWKQHRAFIKQVFKKYPAKLLNH